MNVSRKVKLIDVISEKYPNVTEILIPFPEQWEYVALINSTKDLFYVATLPSAPMQAEVDEFNGLSPAINLQLNTYQMYQLFKPKLISEINYLDKAMEQRIHKEQVDKFKFDFELIGEAKAWFGDSVAVLYRVFISQGLMEIEGEDLICSFLKIIENNIAVNRIFILANEFGIDNKYDNYLSKLGYIQNQQYREWWCKE